MNHRRGHSPKHYKGVLSYKEVPAHPLIIDIKPSNRITKSFRINNCNNNRKCFRICNKRIMRISLCNRANRSLRIIVTKTNRNSIRIKIKNCITKSLKITNNKIQRISAINCNRIGSRTQTLIVGIKSNNSVIKANRKLNNNDNRKCFRINNRRLIKTNLYNKSCKMN